MVGYILWLVGLYNKVIKKALVLPSKVIAYLNNESLNSAYTVRLKTQISFDV